VEHLSSDQLVKLRAGALAGAELRAADEHLAACEECRDRLAAGWAELAGGMRAAAAAAEPHLSFERLQAYVDGNSSPAERMRLESHLLECQSCRGEVNDLKEFAATLQTRRAERFNRYLIFGPIAAALLAGVLWMHPRQQPAPLAVSLRDGGRTVGLDRQGRLVGMNTALGADRDALLAALRDGKIEVAIPGGLRGNQSVLLGADSGEKRFRVLSPVGERVLQDTPEFRWEALDQTRAYQVRVFDADYQPVATSPEVTGTSWTPERPLARGKDYVWQVTAMRGGPPVKAPQPPDREARFQIVDSATAGAIALARQAQAGHLRMAILFAQAGLCGEALAEMDDLARENPASLLVRQIRAGMASQCRLP
jgi:hypothetical protein